MSIQLYIGPMFAGKTSAALQLIDTLTRQKKVFLCITSNLDKRYGEEQIINHNLKGHPATAVGRLLPLIDSTNFLEASHIIIDEAHFFPDLKEFVLLTAETYNKNVTCVGLDGDSNRKPFGEIMDLIPYCDSVTKFKANCRLCNNIAGPQRTAIFTHRIIDNPQQVCVGGTGQYESLCRRHYIAKNF